MDFFWLPVVEFFSNGYEICSGCSKCDDGAALVGEVFDVDG